MKNKIKKILSVLVIVPLMVAVSCSKDTDPADTDLFVGTYNGSISYSDGEETIATTDGSVTVAKVGNSYNFAFSNGIPNITGVNFVQGDDNSYVSIGDGLTGITINASSLNMLVTNSDGTWTADCSR